MTAISVTQRRDARTSFARILADLTGIPPSMIGVTLQTHSTTAAVHWRDHKGWEGETVALSVQLYVPPMLSEAEPTSSDTDALAGYWLHEACHVLYTDKAAWQRACQRSTAFREVVNGLEDVRIERLLIQSGKAPEAATLLRAVAERAVWTGPATPETVNKKQSLAAVLAYLGRATCNGMDLNLASDMRQALTPENRDLVDRALAEVPRLTSTQDVVALADTIFSGTA